MVHNNGEKSESDSVQYSGHVEIKLPPVPTGIWDGRGRCALAAVAEIPAGSAFKLTAHAEVIPEGLTLSLTVKPNYGTLLLPGAIWKPKFF